MEWTILEACLRKLPNNAAFACSTAAWMHGLDTKRSEFLEVAVPKSSGRRSRTGLIVRRCHLAPHEVTEIRGLRVTTLHRTLRDMCLFDAPVEALIAIDAALQGRRTDKSRLFGDALAGKGRRGAARFRRLVELAAPAESPMETRLRWLLLQAGLPKPGVQVNLCDQDGEFVGRADLYFPGSGLVIEYDGGNHRDRLVSDDRRQNLLIRAGFRILRFTAADIFMHPEVVAAHVRGSL